MPSSAPPLAGVSTALDSGVVVTVLVMVVVPVVTVVVVEASGGVGVAAVDDVCGGRSSTLTTVSADDLTDTSSADCGVVTVVVVVVSSTDSSTLVSSWLASRARRLHSSFDTSRQLPSDAAMHRIDDDDASNASVTDAVWLDVQPETTDDDCNGDSTDGRHCVGRTAEPLPLKLPVSKFIRLITNRRLRLVDVVGDLRPLGSVQLPLRRTPPDAVSDV